ncbi:MAG TPA: hypothetical protein VK469_11480 [Candidatus Kapabacteria bacterium]|nr:hypothetical protein [Candidatus Kapabacteria bacterium]
MEKKILYICIILISAYSIYQKISYNSQSQILTQMQKDNNSFKALKESIQVEDLLKGKIIANIKLFEHNDRENFLYDILSNYDSDYYLVIISSIEACSTCREKTLNIWNDLYKKDKNIPIILIISEPDEINKNDRRRIRASINGLNISIPYYFDIESRLLDNLDVNPYQTPLSIILSHNKKIIAVNNANEYTIDRTLGLKKLFMSMQSYEE